MTHGPVFLGGLDRTGKTAMRMEIESRASIAISRRAELWTYHRRRYGSLNDDARARRAVAALMRDPHVASLVHDPAAMVADLLRGPRTDAHLFALIGRQHAEKAGRARWGDQTAMLERHAREILTAFDDACVVHMIRDPRDRFAAALGSDGVGHGGAGAAIERWLESVALADDHAATWPDRYLVVRYEDLAMNPGMTLRRVLGFIGEPVPAAMSNAPLDRLVGGVGRHRLLPHPTIALIERYCSEPMRRHGYEPSQPRLTAAERLGMMLVDRPVTAAIAAAVRVRSGLHGRRTDPGQ